jgi:tetratricopeptide (TPR) repeat protein
LTVFAPTLRLTLLWRHGGRAYGYHFLFNLDKPWFRGNPSVFVMVAGTVAALVFLLPISASSVNELVAQRLARRAAARVEALARALRGTAQFAEAQGDAEVAMVLYEQSLTLYRQLGRRREIAILFGDHGALLLRRGSARWAQQFHEMSLLIWLKLKDRYGVATALQRLGTTSLRQGNARAAASLLGEGLEIRRELGDQQGIAGSLHGLAEVAMSEGNTEEARSPYQQSLAIRQTLGDKAGIAECLEGLAAIELAQEHPEQAARLFGAAAALRGELGAPLPPVEQAEHERQLAAARAALGEERFAAAWAEGQAMPLGQATTASHPPLIG